MTTEVMPSESIGREVMMQLLTKTVACQEGMQTVQREWQMEAAGNTATG